MPPVFAGDSIPTTAECTVDHDVSPIENAIQEVDVGVGTQGESAPAAIPKRGRGRPRKCEATKGRPSNIHLFK